MKPIIQWQELKVLTLLISSHCDNHSAKDFTPEQAVRIAELASNAQDAMLRLNAYLNSQGCHAR